MIDSDATKEVLILRQKLTEAEDRLARVNGALIESVLKTNKTMTRLLTANDVRGDQAMRINILEQMNELGRNIVSFFLNSGATSGTVEEWWPPRFYRGEYASHHNGSEPRPDHRGHSATP